MYVLLFVQIYLACHTCITVIALLFSYIPGFMTYHYIQISKIPLTLHTKNYTCIVLVIVVSAYMHLS